jgi:hypothetical protein
MRILRPTIALVLGLALAPAVVSGAFAQSANSSVPPPSAPATLSGSAPATTGMGANNSAPVGGPGLTGAPHVKTHKRTHKKMYGKHHNYQKYSKGR